MITPITLIKLTEQSDRVANLHAAMKALDIFVDATEVAERRAGDATLKFVRAFQKERDIRFDESLLVDAPTAAAMNELLAERGLLGPEPVVAPDPDFIVKGTITTTIGNPFRDLTVLAFDQDMRIRQELGTARPNAKGEYSIGYRLEQFEKAEKGSADLVVEVRSPHGEILFVSSILFNAPAVAEFDITLVGPQADSEFARIKSEIDWLMDGRDLSILELEENELFQDVTFISGETGIEHEKVAHFIVAHKLGQFRSSLDPEFWYASLRNRVFAGPLAAIDAVSSLEKIAQTVVGAVPTTNRANVEVAINTAIADNLINPRTPSEVAIWLEQFRDFAGAQALNPDGAGSPSDLKLLLDLAGLEESKQIRFAQYYVDSGRDRIEVIIRLRQDDSFSAAEVGNIEKTLVLNDFTLGSLPLIRTLGRSVADTGAIRELAKTRREDWGRLLQDPLATPDFVVGSSPEEKADNYATLLAARFTNEFPTTAFTGGLEHAIRNNERLALEHGDTIAAFFNSHPEFELHTTAIDPAIEIDVSDPSEREAVINELMMTQRIFKVEQSFDAVNVLLFDGIHSARQIYGLGEANFVRRYGTETGFTEASARSAFQRAANTHAAVTTLVGELAAAQNANAVWALSNNSTALNNFPNLQNLFGRADICECEHCRSVYSPAAYFADVLMFLNARDSVTPAKSVKQVLFERRPDIGFLELSCENTNTPLPYVDLACEVLEDRVAPWHLFDLPLTLASSLIKGAVNQVVKDAFRNASPSVVLSDQATISKKFAAGYWIIRDPSETYLIREVGPTTSPTPLPARLSVSILRQTHNSAEELAANPEYVNEAAYAVLRVQKYPFALPFDLFTEELRAYLKKANIKRADLMDVFRGTQPPNNPMALDIAAEYFGIAKDEQPIILLADALNQFVYWGEPTNTAAETNLSRVDVFLQKSGLEYNDLLKLLSMKFIKLNSSISVVHLDSSCDTNQKRIEVLDVTGLDRIHRFLRLWRKLGWKMWEVDLVVNHPLIGNVGTGSGFIERLKPFAELKAKFPALTVEQLCAFFGNLNTTPKFTESYQAPEPSLYEQLFLNKRLSSPIDPSFEVSAVTTPTATLAEHLPPILAALKVSEADLTVFTNLKRPENGPGYLPNDLLSLTNLSSLYRHAQLSRLLKLKASEWQTLLYLAQVDPFQSTQATRDFVAAVERIRASKFSIDELNYVLAADITAKAAQPEKNITTFLTALRGDLKKIAAEYDPGTLPNGAEALTPILAALLLKLNRSEEIITGIVELMNDQNINTFHLTPNTADPFPPDFDFSTTNAKDFRITYDGTNNNISFTGVMTNAIKKTLLTDISLDVVRTRDDYPRAINTLYDGPRTFIRKEMKFFVAPVFSTPLDALPFEVDFAGLPQDLSARIFFDAEHKLLQFTGEMTAAEEALLVDLLIQPSDPINFHYRNAISQLHTLSTTTVFADKDLWITAADIVALFDNPTIPLSGPDDHVAVRLKSVTAQVYDYFRPIVLGAFAVQRFSEELGVSPAIAKNLLTTSKLFGTPVAHPLIEDFTSDSFVNSNDFLISAVHANRYTGYYWLHRLTLVIKQMKLTFSDLEWIIRNHVPAEVLDFQSLPGVYGESLPSTTTLPGFLNLSDFMQLHQRYSDETLSLLDVVELVIKDIIDAAYDNGKFSVDVERLTEWKAADIKYLTDTDRLNVAYPSDYAKVENWKRLGRAMEIIGKLNGSAQSVLPLAAATIGQAESLSIKQMLRSKYEIEQWLDISKEIQDELRHRKLNSLVAYLLTQPMPPDAPTHKWDNANDLYAYYLIDVEMCSCQFTSRIVQALAAIQLFVQRCFMGLEPQVRVSAEADDVWPQWKWMKNYRVWEANRKVFLYPENWIAPELRRDKSQFFKDLENELLQNEVNRDNVETAFLNYIEKLDQVSQLEIAGTFYQEDNHTLHVFARTPGGEPHTYYYRQRVDDRRWTFWSKVECEIKGDFLIPIVMEQRLYLVWPEFREEPVEVDKVKVPSAGDSGFATQKPLKHTRIHLAISQYRSNKWSPKKMSKDFMDAGTHSAQTLDRSHYFIVPLDFTYLPGGKFLIVFYPLLARDIASLVRAYYAGLNTTPQIFELLGCKGYPEKSLEPFSFFPTPTRFARDEFRFMKNSEVSSRATEGKGRGMALTMLPDALIPSTSRYLTETIMARTPGDFKISYPHYLSYFDKLFVGPQDVDNTKTGFLGTYYNWFYADQARTFFVRPQVRAIRNNTASYKQLVPIVSDVFKLIEPARIATTYAGIASSYQWRQETRLLFENFYHPHTCLFAKQLYNHGVAGLMSRETQFADNKLDFSDVYGPNNNVVNTNYPQEVVDFAPGGSYSQYNWELFFHAPLMIAMQLSKNRQFEEAMHWFHYIFDPTGVHDRDPITGALAPAPQRYWNTKPFYQTTSQAYTDQRIDNILKMLAGDPAHPTNPAVKQELVNQVADWRANPFDPHLIAQFRTVAYQKTTVMKYIDNLIAWGDQLFRLDTMESVNEAAQLYVQAAQILGPKPRKVPPPQKPAVVTFNELEGSLDAFSNAIVNFENLIPLLPGDPPPTKDQLLPGLLYFCIPQNDQLLGYWDTVADRLYKIRHCLSIEGVFRQLSLFAPPIDPGALVKAVAAGVDISSALSDLNAPLPHYRFSVMLQKANEVTSDVKALGGALLSALEKKDAEAIALLRQSHELRLLEAVKAIKEQQIDDAKLAREGLQKNKELITIRRDFYSSREFLNPGEFAAMALSSAALIPKTAGTVADGLSSVMFLLPDFNLGAAGLATPYVVAKTGGSSLGKSSERGANVLHQVAAFLEWSASIVGTLAGYQRRKQDWEFQESLANKELEQIDKQIASAELKISIAEKELENHELQKENSKAIDEFMHSKYTNQELYDWMSGQISQVYFQSYQLAYDLAKRAEKCFQYELGVENTSYIQFGYWDSLKKGLLSGEKLQYDLRRLDTAYIDQNRREFELTKHVSLALTNPTALLQLKENGWCFFDLPEELFDLDYQGHYFRRIKSVSLSIPCIAGPHTTVNGTLRLIKNSVRINTQLGDGHYEHNGEDGVFSDDLRFRESLVNVKSIATSSAQNDSGMFDLNFRDERYLPFEGAGAISTWKLELTDTKALRQFDYDSISDVVMHMKYTAREDAGTFKSGAVGHLTDIITGAASQLSLRRLFNLKHEFPTAWYAFFNPPAGADKQLVLALSKELFPFFAQEKTIAISAVSLFVKSNSTADPQVNEFQVQFIPPLPEPLPQPSLPQLTLIQTQSIFGSLYWDRKSELSIDLAETTPWTMQMKKVTGVNDDIGDAEEADVEECFMVVEYFLLP